MTRLTNRLLRKACRIAAESSAVQAELTIAFTKRYGTTYSDVDADGLIDALDYGGGGVVTVDECDRDMTDRGHPPLSSQARGGAAE